MTTPDEKAIMEEAAQIVARRMMEDVRMKAKKEFIEQLWLRACYAVDHTKDEPLRSHLVFMRDEYRTLLDNEVNWRTL